MSVVAAARGVHLDDSIEPYNNSLVNSKYDNENYPVWTGWNGQPYASTTTKQVGERKGIAGWLHHSPLFNQGYSSYIGNQFLYNHEPYNLDGFYPFEFVPRIIKVYGAGQLYTGQVQNNDPDRGAGYIGPITNQNHVRICSNTTISGGPTSYTTMASTMMWSRVTEWTQQISVPSGATSVTFGARIKVSSDDKLRPLNWAGIYCCQDHNPAYQVFHRYVNYFGIRHTNATFSLPTGTLTGNNAQYNWSGLHTSTVLSGGNVRQMTPTTTYVTEHAMLDQDDYEEFQKVEYTFNLQSNLSRLNFNIFFAENTSYLNAATAGVTTGGLQVYDPFVEFS